MHRVSIGRKALSRSQPCSARLAGFVLASVQSFDPREQQVVLCPTNAAPFVGRLRGRLFHARPLKPRLPLLAPVTRSPTNSAALLRERERERERASEHPPLRRPIAPRSSSISKEATSPPFETNSSLFSPRLLSTACIIILPIFRIGRADGTRNCSPPSLISLINHVERSKIVRRRTIFASFALLVAANKHIS